jgi:hypothetical protein
MAVSHPLLRLPSQLAKPLLQTSEQLPRLQKDCALLVGQVLLQLPQFPVSSSLEQKPAQSRYRHLQVPPTQNSLTAQAVEQLPQCSSSDERSVQTPLQKPMSGTGDDRIVPNERSTQVKGTSSILLRLLLF